MKMILPQAWLDLVHSKQFRVFEKQIFAVFKQILVVFTVWQTGRLFSLRPDSINNMIKSRKHFENNFTLRNTRNMVGSIVFERNCASLSSESIEEIVKAGVDAVKEALDHDEGETPWYYIDPRLLWKVICYYLQLDGSKEEDVNKTTKRNSSKNQNNNKAFNPKRYIKKQTQIKLVKT